jgi:hypothetical protein
MRLTTREDRAMLLRPFIAIAAFFIAGYFILANAKGDETVCPPVSMAVDAERLEIIARDVRTLREAALLKTGIVNRTTIAADLDFLDRLSKCLRTAQRIADQLQNGELK